MTPRELLFMFKRQSIPSVLEAKDLALAQLEVLVSIDDRLARMEPPQVMQALSSSVPLSSLAEPAFDPLRDCEQDQEDLGRMGVDDCPVCGEPSADHRNPPFGEPPDRPGSDAT